MPRPLPPNVVRALDCRRWTETEGRLVLDAAARLGLSHAEFARKYHVGAQRLNTWRRRLAPATTTAPPLAFIEVPAPTATPARATPRYEVHLVTGEILRVEGEVDLASVGALLALLRGTRPC